MNLMFEPLKKYAVFDGRSRRSEYWLFALFIWLVNIALSSVISTTGGYYDLMRTGHLGGAALVVFPLFGLFGLAMLLPSLAVTVRRLHDTDRSGWWILIALVPLLGAVVLLIFMLLDGTAGPNRYGPDPKGRQSLTSTITETNPQPFGAAPPASTEAP